MDLNPGEVICIECLGSGESIAYNLCPKCHGNGKLDWVEAVVGKKYKIMPELKASGIINVQPLTSETGEVFKL